MKNKPTSINITPEDLKAADEAARVAGVSRSAWIVSAIRAALAGNLQPVQPAADTLAAQVADLAERLATLEQAAKPTAATPKPAAKPAKATKPKERVTFRPGVHVPNPEAISRMMALDDDGGLTRAQIAEQLNAEGFTTPTGQQWIADTVRDTLHRKRKAAQRKAAK
ncbi:recombinase family protein [Buttiauxella sp. S04-F03]|uniref:recombinase family protein n=1 Tax=Buttiauxella sp. S04-F03 TaxID=2904525 RepID=UPI001E4A64F7|nr:recombinase family protein [Buttiauxella sp. S04-F03]MCE0814999.1 recombinase family protein [Buttiauxella sp. S04-F03]